MNNPPTLLIINADDLGVSPSRDRGIFEAYAMGGIKHASLLVAGPTAPDAVQQARQLGLPLGLHLDLTETAACAAKEQIPSLLNPAGAKLGKFGFPDALFSQQIDPEHIRRETTAQLERFKQLTGYSARHFDGHHHIHVLAPLVDIVAAVCAQFGVVSTRVPEQEIPPFADPVQDQFYRRIGASAAAARRKYQARGIRSTQAFCGIELMGFEMQVSRLQSTVQSLLPTQSIELMCHPGYASQTGDPFDQSPARQSELQVLTSGPFNDLVAQGLLVLGSFTELP